MPKGYGFTKDNADRILRATEVVERQLRNLPYVPPPAKVESDGFYARITSDCVNLKYSWETVTMNNTGYMATNSDQWTGSYADSTGYAVEKDSSKWVLKQDIVWMTPALTEDHLVFSYAGGVRVGWAFSIITARTPSLAGFGQVRIETFDEATRVLSTGPQVITVYNNFRTRIEANTWVQITYGKGVWWVTAADCDTDGTSQ